MRGAVHEGEFELPDGRRATVRLTREGWVITIAVELESGGVTKPLTPATWERLRPSRSRS